jgi:protoporphyrinogen oxidase
MVDALVKIGFIQGFLVLASYFKSQVFPRDPEDTFDAWVENRFGKHLYRIFFQTYTEKVWGIPCSQIRADWAVQRIKGLSLTAAVSNAIFRHNSAKSLIGEFRYPKKGSGMMWERFCQKIEAGGGVIRLGHCVERIECSDGRVTGVSGTSPDGDFKMPTWHLFSSMPLGAFVEKLYPAPPNKVRTAARGLGFRALIIVVLIVDKKDLFPDQWIYVHSSDVRTGRIQNFKNWSAAMVPDPAMTSVGMEYFCDTGEELWNMPDAGLAELAKDELCRLSLAEKDDIKDHFIIRQPYAYPIYDTGYKERLSDIRKHLSVLSNLQTIGRNGLFRYNNMDHSIQTGFLAAEHIKEKKCDLWSIDVEGYLEERGRRKLNPLIEKILSATFARMDKIAFALAVGMVAGFWMFVATIFLVIKGGDVVGPHLQLLSQVFIGYTVTLRGAFIALGYSFFWGFLLGWVFAYLRNFFLAFTIYQARKKVELVSLSDFFDNL